MMFGISRTLIMAGVIVLLIVLAITLGPAACNRIRSLTAQNRLNQEQMDAQANSAADAVNTQSEANKRERESEDLTRSNEKEIRGAEGANDPVNPGVNDAGLKALCSRAAYKNHPRCQPKVTP